MGENKMESDILYILIRKGEIKDTVEISEDLFIEYDENNKIVGIELWRTRKNIFGEFSISASKKFRKN